MSLGTNLYELRKKAKMTRQEVAEHLNVKPNTYGNWENDKTEPSGTYLLKLAKLFNVKMEDLYRESNSLESDTIAKEKLIVANIQIIDILQSQLIEIGNA